jgi:CheY-like chemotaxis protein
MAALPPIPADPGSLPEITSKNAAAGGAEALMAADSHPQPIPPLLTDLVLPGMNGRELADQIHQIHPGMKAIFMPRNTDRLLTGTNTPGSGTPFLQKPFTLPKSPRSCDRWKMRVERETGALPAPSTQHPRASRQVATSLSKGGIAEAVLRRPRPPAGRVRPVATAAEVLKP